jgi:flagellin-like protein
MKITNAQKRKAISPVIATVILIAITLIAAIAIAGFVFGLFGSFTSTAQVLVSSASCTPASSPPGATCTLTLSNSGTANTAIVASTFTLTYGGVKYGGSCATAVVITAGTAAAATCSVASGTAAAGEQFTGSLGLSNGGVVSFSGTF